MLVDAFLRELEEDGPPLERRRFLRHIAESAVGPLPPRPGARTSRADTPGPAAQDAAGSVGLSEAVALAAAVVGQFERPAAGPGEQEAPASVHSPISRGAAVRELAGRVRRRVSALSARRRGSAPGGPR